MEARGLPALEDERLNDPHFKATAQHSSLQRQAKYYSELYHKEKGLARKIAQTSAGKTNDIWKLYS